MKNFKIISIDDKEWDETIKESLNCDFYHSQSYNLLESTGETLLLKQELEGDFIAMPIILRDIPETNYKDCTSVYGYSGPISNKDIECVEKKMIDLFIQNMKHYFKNKNVVSCFSRLHPIFNNDTLLRSVGEILDLNKTVGIDLSLPLDEQKRSYRKSNKYEINKLKKKGYLVVEGKTKSDIDEFINIYNETMRRVSASENYFFSNEYFNSFLSNDSFETKLLLAKMEGVITAGAIFTISNGIMQYHLAGTRGEFSKDTPMKLILDEARLLGFELNLKYLHLGGGVGGSDEDSLFRFKSGFSKKYFQFKIWKYICDENKYSELVNEFCNDKKSSFFPLYRA